MSHHDVSHPDELDWPVSNPWPFLIAGLALTGLALILSNFMGASGVPFRVGLIVAGLIAAGGAVSLRLAAARWDLEERFRSAGIVALAALAALFGCLALDPAWGTARLALGVLTTLALVGAGLILLPRTARRAVVSALLLFHFGGILMAVTSVPPASGPAPWMTTQIWTRIYRPYLQFMYLNNAYHFYSPEPGPPTLLWFYVQYSDGSSRWVKMPNREEFHTKLEFQRRLALTESANMLTGPVLDFEDRWRKRVDEANRTGIPLYPPQILPPIHQHREPTPYSKLMTSTYARHVARNYPSETNPEAKVVGVKVYRVVHRILGPGEMAAGVDPYGPMTFQPFYHGEFDANGKLMNREDPFLYWAIPIMVAPKQEPAPFVRIGVPTPPQPTEMELYDYLKIHAEKVKTRIPQREAPE